LPDIDDDDDGDAGVVGLDGVRENFCWGSVAVMVPFLEDRLLDDEWGRVRALQNDDDDRDWILLLLLLLVVSLPLLLSELVDPLMSRGCCVSVVAMVIEYGALLSSS
jgi:hypothetical protein